MELLHTETFGKAGITAFYNQSYYYSLSLAKKDGKTVLLLESCIHGIPTIIAEIDFPSDTVRLAIQSDRESYDFQYWDHGIWKSTGKLPTAGLCAEGTMMMTFTGTYLGLFAVNAKACFTSFSVMK